jgi:PhnB protein
VQIYVYLHFNGNCEEAFKFYEKVLGGSITATFPFKGTPAEQQVPSEWGDKMMHASMKVGNTILMASDAPPGRYQPAQGFSVSINLTDTVEGERIFKALGEGGTVIMPFQQTFWAKGFGMLVDQFGTPWMINCSENG